jgi:hypothetical protein
VVALTAPSETQLVDAETLSYCLPGTTRAITDLQRTASSAQCQLLKIAQARETASMYRVPWKIQSRTYDQAVSEGSNLPVKKTIWARPHKAQLYALYWKNP